MVPGALSKERAAGSCVSWGISGLRESPDGGNLKTLTVDVWSPGFQISEDTVSLGLGE